MSIILKPSALKVKDDNGNYIGTNMFAAESTQEYLDAIETIGTQTQTAISTASTQAQSAMEAKAEQTIESIPEDYTELAGDVSELKADLNELHSDNSTKPYMIDGNLSYTEEKSYQMTLSDGYTTNSGGQTPTATSYMTSGFILNEDLPDTIDVYGLVTDGSISAVVNMTTAEPPAYSGWKWGNLPTSFMTKHDGYVTIDITYARTHSSKGLAFNFVASAEDKSIRYFDQITNTVKRLKWLNINRVIVDGNGNGDYLTIQEAVDAVVDGDEIVIMPGTYEESVNTGTKYVYLHGMGANVTKIVNHTGDYNTPPLWMCKGIVEGLTIFAEKTVEVSPSRYSYGIHLDSHWGNDINMRSMLIKNCIIKSDFAGPIGCGVIDGSKINIVNTLIISTGITNQAVSAFQIHGDSSTVGNADIIIENSKFSAPLNGGGHGILFSNGGNNTGTVFNLMVNNSVLSSFYNNCGDLLNINNLSYNNNIQALNLAPTIN